MSAFDSVRAEIEANGLYDPETGREIIAPIDPPIAGQVKLMTLPTWDELHGRDKMSKVGRPSIEAYMGLTGASRERAELTRIPHAYRPTEPYRGCDICGQGPGAYQHNPCAKPEDFK